MKSFIKLLVSVLSISALVGCGEVAPEEPLPDEGGEQVQPTHTHTFSHDYGHPATFFADGVVEHNHCTGCNKDFDMEGNEITDTKIPQLSHDLALGVNGVIQAEFTADLSEFELQHINWNIASISLQKGDLITLCKSGDASVTYDYFISSNSNITEEHKVHNNVDNGTVDVHATPNGLTLSISGFEFDGIVIKINDTMYQMNEVTYYDGNQKSFIYGYANISVNDKVVVIDKDNNITYDYDDLEADSTWNVYDFHKGSNDEIVFDYEARYGFEFDRGGDKKISITKAFGPCQSNSTFTLEFDGDRPDETLNKRTYAKTSNEYKEAMWYVSNQCVINNSDILAFAESNGLILHLIYTDFVAGEKFNIKDYANNVTYKADHLVDNHTHSGNIIIEGDYIKVLVTGSYEIIFSAATSSFAIYNSSMSTGDAYLYKGGEFISLHKDSNNVIHYQNLVMEKNKYIAFADNTMTLITDVTLDSTVDSTIWHKSSSGLIYFDRAGTFNIHLNLTTKVVTLDIIDVEEQLKVFKVYDSDGSGSNRAFSPEFVKSTENTAEYCLLNYTVQYGWLTLTDWTSGSMEAIEDATLTEGSEIVTIVNYFYIIQTGKTCNFYYNPTAKTLKVVEVI